MITVLRCPRARAGATDPSPLERTRLGRRRQQILEAFRKRLHHYGYDKTTMAEIASDVGISVGTLYLEFDSKEDILAAVMEETTRDFEETFRGILSSQASAAEKLRDVLLARVALSDRCCREGAHAGEVLLAGAEKCRRMSSEKEDRYLGLVARLLEDGIAAGEFEVCDVAGTSGVLRDAITAYLPPRSMTWPSEEVVARAGTLVDVLIRGLAPQPARVP